MYGPSGKDAILFLIFFVVLVGSITIGVWELIRYLLSSVTVTFN